MRNHKQYFGRLVNFTDAYEVPVKGAFFILDSFSYNPSQKTLNFTFNGWASADAFDRGIQAIPSARHEYIITDEDFLSFKEANSAAILEIQDILREYANLGGENWRFERLSVNPTETILTATFSKGDSLRIIHEEKAAYETLIGENAGIVQSTVEIAWLTALTTDDFFLNAIIIEGEIEGE